MSRRLQHQLKSITLIHVSEPPKVVTTMQHNPDEAHRAFPKHGKRTDAKLQRLQQYARKGGR